MVSQCGGAAIVSCRTLQLAPRLWRSAVSQPQALAGILLLQLTACLPWLCDAALSAAAIWAVTSMQATTFKAAVEQGTEVSAR